ncbi:SIS domain-containing protein [uncultured Dysosmobacter sp.]|uniref:SIS domain-containing protein n=1 Tax=uncultured Dysosmobacter sp. TaxID=2591384 RepID=UPI0026195E86|nr:SIS domain-containing protein [uncultured Dysosmobacter sp.]
MNLRENIQACIEKEIQVLRALDYEELNRAVNAILDTRNRGGTIYTMGNGGSAATASHMVCDLAKGTSEALGGPRFHVECLSDNTPIMMAIANSFCYEDIFVYQLQGQLKPRDLVIAISSSGNSENVLRAIRYAKAQGASVVGITGYSGGEVKELADYSMHVAINDMQISEDVHMIFDHVIMRVLSKTKSIG